MVLHLAESKAAWAAWAARPSSLAALAPYAAPPAGGRAPRACFEVDHLGGLTPDPALGHAGAVPEQHPYPLTLTPTLTLSLTPTPTPP